MERESKIALGLIALSLAVLGGSYLYNRNKKPKIESYDNFHKTFKYTINGLSKTEKLIPESNTKIGKYTVEPMLDDKKQVMGVSIKDESGNVIDSMYSTPEPEIEDDKITTSTSEKNNRPSDSESQSNQKSTSVYSILSPKQVGMKEWSNLKKLGIILANRIKKQNPFSTLAAKDNPSAYMKFNNYVTQNEYNAIGQFLAMFKKNETDTLKSMGSKKSLVESGMKKIFSV